MKIAILNSYLAFFFFSRWNSNQYSNEILHEDYFYASLFLGQLGYFQVPTLPQINGTVIEILYTKLFFHLDMFA